MYNSYASENLKLISGWIRDIKRTEKEKYRESPGSLLWGLEFVIEMNSSANFSQNLFPLHLIWLWYLVINLLFNAELVKYCI